MVVGYGVFVHGISLLVELWEGGEGGRRGRGIADDPTARGDSFSTRRS